MTKQPFQKWRSAALVALSIFAADMAVNTQAYAGAPQDFSSTVKPLLPAVVNISTTVELTADKRVPGMGGSPLEELFRQFLEEQQGGGGRPRKGSSLGSGFLISQDGKTAYVVTCNHVVADADEIKVTLHDGDDFKAEIVGRDPRTDLALLKFTCEKKLTTVSWGDSTKADVGQWLIAIGNPFGLSSTVTIGIISSTGRDIGARPTSRDGRFADYVDGYIQTDASINMGNSGGPMFNTNGEVIGISTAIFSPNGGNIGIGFGIPSDLAKQVIAQLREFGKTKRGWLGVRIQMVTPEIAASLGLKKPWGALVGEVSPKSPSAKAGVMTGDVILKFNGHDIKESRMLPRMVGEAPIGQDAPLVVWRDGKEVTLTLRVGEFEQAESDGLLGDSEGEEDDAKPAPNGPQILGMSLKPLTLEQRKRFGVEDEGITGLVIANLDPRSEAADKGLRPGDVLVELTSERQKIKPKSSDDLQKFVDTAKKEKRKQLLVLVNRQGSPRYLTLSLEEDDAEKEDKKTADKAKKKS
ncbi:MAG: Do family serine endopeptidase [Proteobacteria bacterium]|nr:Do family serine endopeptidase [Pseudomonadota bacterium]